MMLASGIRDMAYLAGGGETQGDKKSTPPPDAGSGGMPETPPATPEQRPAHRASNGQSSIASAAPVRLATSGLDQNTESCPSENSIDWRNASSALSPSTAASTSGAMG